MKHGKLLLILYPILQNMENQECNRNMVIRHLYSEFMSKIAKFDELVTQGSKLIIDFQRGVNFLGRTRVEKTSTLVDDIIKSNETKRLSSYLKAGGFQVPDVTENLSRLNFSHRGLKEHLIKGKCILDELEVVLGNATTELKTATEKLYSNDKMSSEEVIYDQKRDYADYAAAMAILCSMVKQDFRMQEQIVMSLSLKSSSGELESYSLMWSLRPCIDEDFMCSAWKLIL